MAGANVKFFGRRKMMKNILTVLVMASVANASLLISVDGVVDPPETEIWLAPSDHLVIDIWGNGVTPPNIIPWLIVEGKATVSGGVMLYPGTWANLFLFEEGDGSGNVEWLQSEGYNTKQAYYVELVDNTPEPPPLSGTLVDEIALHCDGCAPCPEEVLLTLASWDLTWTIYDNQVIHQIPDPATILLLGFGSVMLRRKRN